MLCYYVQPHVDSVRGHRWPDDIEWNRPETYRMVGVSANANAPAEL